MRTLAVWALLTLLPLVCDISSAATLYRCGPSGHAYSQTPCPDGQRMEVDDSRTPEQHMQARVLAERTRDQALDMERARLDKEAAFRAAVAGSLSSPVTAQLNKKTVRSKAHRVKKMRSTRAPAGSPKVLRIEPVHPARLGTPS